MLSQLAPIELLIATYNQGKVGELRDLLSAFTRLRLRSLAEFAHVKAVQETGSTFAVNAVLKAESYGRQCGLLTIADDSGLEVEALSGAPGVYSARYGGPGLTEAQRTERLLAELAATGGGSRRARFVCAVALFQPTCAPPAVFQGVCAGSITPTPRGQRGFGYDPIFQPDGYAQTFGELSKEVKQLISHRARALKAAKLYLACQFPSINRRR